MVALLQCINRHYICFHFSFKAFIGLFNVSGGLDCNEQNTVRKASEGND